MNNKVNGKQIAIIVVAVVFSSMVARYEDFVPYFWNTIQPPDKSFSVDLPAKPDMTSQDLPIPNSPPMKVHTFMAQPLDKSAFSVAWMEHPNLRERTEEVLKGAKEGSISNVQGRLESESRTTFQGYPALDYKVRARGDAEMDARLIAVGSRLYMLLVVAQPGKRSPKHVDRFFSSLKIHDK